MLVSCCILLHANAAVNFKSTLKILSAAAGWMQADILVQQGTPLLKTWVQGFLYQAPCLRQSCCHDYALQTVGGRKEKKKRRWGVAKQKKKERKTKLLLRTIYVNSLPSCEVNSCRTLALRPPSEQRDGAASVSANTTSDGLKRWAAKLCMRGIKEKRK